MDRKEFTSPNGSLEEIGDGRLAFVPRRLPPSINLDRELVGLAVVAERNVARLGGIGEALADPRPLVRAHLKAEAVHSSRIEGTAASLGDLDRSEVAGEPEEAEEIRLREVANCARAQDAALERVGAGGRIGTGLVLGAHREIMTGVRGGDRTPGRLRDVQNWIVSGRRIVYTPPPPDRVPGLLADLEEFVGKEHDISPLVKCAVAHYQFEAIHPFRDGNGRTGRLLLPLILREAGLMPVPLLYLSAYFEENLPRYYGGLLAVSQRGDWEGWISFFLEAFAARACSTIRSIGRMREIHRGYRVLLERRGAGARPVRLAGCLVENPFVTIPRAQSYLGTSYPTARNAVQALLDAGILEAIGQVRGKKAYRAPEMAAVLG
ncbi:Fic family protein [Nitrosopumilaceae archaeon]|nr:Fic family protein [Nitrosopumilus sp.]CAI9832075.1 Fic family protein [Nitrosopumilaceae archaeon]MDA7945413.1 Fic family protein [Nitrosopumilus sp.]MDA7954414.1 Fic family protein [Nitrosopumilus sp.]MDA7973537.1 Fic family protein [Nitrosopumilus sp.]